MFEDSAGSVKKEIEAFYGLKECYIALNRSIPSINGIKLEQFSEEEYLQDSFTENNDCIKDFQELDDLKEEHSPKLEPKEEHIGDEISCSETVQKDSFEELDDLKEEHSPNLVPKEEHIGDEISCSETIQKDSFEVNTSQIHNLSPQDFSTNHLPYQCTSCNYVFGIKSSFIDHERICKESFSVPTVTEKRQKNKAVDKKRFVCCEELFTVFQLFNSHKLSIHGIEFLACGLCDREEETPKRLYKHYRDNHFPGFNILLIFPHSVKKKKPTDSLVVSARIEEECTAAQEGILCQCPVCDRKVSYDKSVSKPYACKLCNFRFRFKSRLKRHMNTHNSKNYPCNICAKTFTLPSTVKHHKLTQHNSGTNPYKVTCNICFKELATKSSLTKHVRKVHLDLHRYKSKELSCPHCQKTLTGSKSLAAHVKLHLKDSQYICHYCSKVFFSRKHINNHIQSQHLNEGPMKCDICGDVLKTIQSMRVHKTKKHSKDIFSCEICGKISGTKSQIKRHLITHNDERPFVCQTCGKTFKRECNLTQHQYIHSNDRTYLCDICGQSFRLRTHVKQHMAVHGSGNNHKCLVCNKFFARKKELNLHMSVHEMPTK